MENDLLVTLDMSEPIWSRVFHIAPLVVVGTREGDDFDLAPKHMATPMGWNNFFGFVCASTHATYHNAKTAGSFTVSYPRPEQLAMTSLTASPRQPGPGPEQPILSTLPTIPATIVDGIFLQNAYLMLECELEKVVDDLGPNSLIIGRIVAARVHRDALRVSDGNDQEQIYESPLLAYVNPGRYAVVKETQAFPFPANFKY